MLCYPATRFHSHFYVISYEALHEQPRSQLLPFILSSLLYFLGTFHSFTISSDLFLNDPFLTLILHPARSNWRPTLRPRSHGTLKRRISLGFCLWKRPWPRQSRCKLFGIGFGRRRRGGGPSSSSSPLSFSFWSLSLYSLFFLSFFLLAWSWSWRRERKKEEKKMVFFLLLLLLLLLLSFNRFSLSLSSPFSLSLYFSRQEERRGEEERACCAVLCCAALGSLSSLLAGSLASLTFAFLPRPPQIGRAAGREREWWDGEA